MAILPGGRRLVVLLRRLGRLRVERHLDHGIAEAQLRGQTLRGLVAPLSGGTLDPGPRSVQLGAPLFFANAELFHERVLDAVASSPTPVRWLVVAAEPVTSVDVTAADVVCELDDALRGASIE